MKTILLSLVFALCVHADVVNYVIEMDDPNLSESEVTAIRNKGACWEEVSHTPDGSRVMMDVLLDDGQISGLMNCLGGYHPSILGCWNFDGTQRGTSRVVTMNSDMTQTTTIVGTPSYPFNSARWLAMTPRKPIIDPATMQITGWQAETRIMQIHKFGGWEDRLFDDGNGNYVTMSRMFLKRIYERA